ncbi:MAG: methyltransferase protein, partial [Thermomicrobiales bacterium]|nr:methyltransferase protein [Thermomicrobiales bacterium]
MTESPSTDWNPAQYERFRDERSRPFFDLLNLVQPQPQMRVVDLGCGTGELTRELHRRLSARETIGVDNSPAMLAKSSAFAGDGLRFEQKDIAAFASEGDFDLVFSNAALQWVPDHEPLFRRLTAALTQRGQLAVQMPAN